MSPPDATCTGGGQCCIEARRAGDTSAQTKPAPKRQRRRGAGLGSGRERLRPEGSRYFAGRGASSCRSLLSLSTLSPGKLGRPFRPRALLAITRPFEPGWVMSAPSGLKDSRGRPAFLLPNTTGWKHAPHYETCLFFTRCRYQWQLGDRLPSIRGRR